MNRKVEQCISCLKAKFMSSVTEIDAGIFLCDDCLKKVESYANLPLPAER
jgi:ribosomal protein L37AE/L43A